jgi:hypothetical protein
MATKQMSLRGPLYIAAVSVAFCALIWLGWGIYLYWNDVKLLNFLAAWIPFVLSILIAFLPEHEMNEKKKVFRRFSIILIGFAWSVVLWHQQVIADAKTSTDQQSMVTEAVKQSNLHSDQQIGAVRSDVQGVKKDLEDKISDTVSKSTSNLSESIGKVNKPSPPELARLQFTLWKDGMSITELPILTNTIHAELDGTYSVGFSFSNISSTSADAVEIVAMVCDQCSFASEPANFTKLNGASESQRHRSIGDINPSVTFEKMLISVKVPQYLTDFEIGFNYSCKTCGKSREWQEVKIHMLR